MAHGMLVVLNWEVLQREQSWSNQTYFANFRIQSTNSAFEKKMVTLMFNIFLLYRSLPAWRLCHHGSLLIQLEITHKLYVASRRLAEAAACTLRLRGPHQPLSPPLIHRLLLAAAEVEQTCPPPSASSELCAHQRFGVCACMRERERASKQRGGKEWGQMSAQIVVQLKWYTSQAERQTGQHAGCCYWHDTDCSFTEVTQTVALVRSGLSPHRAFSQLH